MTSRYIALSAVALTIPLSVTAQEAGERRLDSVTVSGLRPVLDARLTEDVAILDAEDLSIRDTPYVADQLRAVPGVAVSRSGSVGGLTQVRVRGAEANHTLVLLDGIEFSDPVTGETDFGLLSSLGVDRIEVLRGEHSSLYGSDAIGGVIGIYTSNDPNLRGDIEAGSFETLRGSIGVGTDLGGFRLQGAASGFTTDGIDTSGRGGETDGSQNGAFLLKAATDLSDDWSLSTLATYRDTYVESDPDLDFDGQLDNADRTTDGEQWLIGAALTGVTGPIDHVFRANYNDVARTNEADGVYVDETSGERTKFSWSPSFSTDGVVAQTVSLLADYEREDYERRSTDTAFGDPNQSRSFETTGLAAEYRVRVGGFNANASLRQDFNGDNFDDATSWRAGASYTFDYRGRVRGAIGRGVKNPTFTELFGFYPGSFIGNPDVQPETSTSWEIGYDQEWKNSVASITYFHADLEDEIYTAYTPTFLSTPMNRVGESERSGVEAAFRTDLSKTVNLSAQLTNTQSEDDTGADEIRVPEWTGSLAVSWQPNENGARYGAALDYVGEQDDFNFGVFPTERVTLDAYTLFSATAEIPLNDRIALTLRGQNLLDEDAVDVLGYASPGAAGFIGLKLR
ncbi:TonB-dependent receptor [Henriciella sp. AS95]|uniref:TonB-dependent receptor plug domain-containing protein n=1 Tax=Henriciella sp. AS95 TaxID=3135782 RepID=UPI0031787DB8